MNTNFIQKKNPWDRRELRVADLSATGAPCFPLGKSSWGRKATLGAVTGGGELGAVPVHLEEVVAALVLADLVGDGTGGGFVAEGPEVQPRGVEVVYDVQVEVLDQLGIVAVELGHNRELDVGVGGEAEVHDAEVAVGVGDEIRGLVGPVPEVVADHVAVGGLVVFGHQLGGDAQGIERTVGVLVLPVGLVQRAAVAVVVQTVLELAGTGVGVGVGVVAVTVQVHVVGGLVAGREAVLGEAVAVTVKITVPDRRVRGIGVDDVVAVVVDLVADFLGTGVDAGILVVAVARGLGVAVTVDVVAFVDAAIAVVVQAVLDLGGGRVDVRVGVVAVVDRGGGDVAGGLVAGVHGGLLVAEAVAIVVDEPGFRHADGGVGVVAVDALVDAIGVGVGYAHGVDFVAILVDAIVADVGRAGIDGVVGVAAVRVVEDPLAREIRGDLVVAGGGGVGAVSVAILVGILVDPGDGQAFVVHPIAVVVDGVADLLGAGVDGRVGVVAIHARGVAVAVGVGVVLDDGLVDLVVAVLVDAVVRLVDRTRVGVGVGVVAVATLGGVAVAVLVDAVADVVFVDLAVAVLVDAVAGFGLARVDGLVIVVAVDGLTVVAGGVAVAVAVVVVPVARDVVVIVAGVPVGVGVELGLGGVPGGTFFGVGTGVVVRGLLGGVVGGGALRVRDVHVTAGAQSDSEDEGGQWGQDAELAHGFSSSHGGKQKRLFGISLAHPGLMLKAAITSPVGIVRCG